MAPGIPPVNVAAPPPAPGRIVGLYAAASLVDEPRSVVGGVEVNVDTAGGHGLWVDPCTPGDSVKEGGDDGTNLQFPGTAVWAAEECYLVGVSEQDAKDRARQRLARFEPIEVERHLAPLLDDKANAGTTQAATLAAAQAEVLLAGMSPVVHIAPESLEAMISAKQIMLVGQRLVTPLGAQVAVGAGYTDVLGAGEVIVTGPVTVWRSPVEVHVGLGLTKNKRLAVAERGIAVSWQGPTIKIGGTP